VKILAVDTSGFEGSVAISQDRHVLAERCLNAEGRRHAQLLVLEVGELLKSQQLQPTDIDVVAVSIGPGSFTGLRVGVVFAKTFAWANNAKLVAVDTLQAVAQQQPEHHSVVTVVSDAQRGEVFCNRYEWDADSQSRIATGELSIKAVDAVAESTCGVVTGPGLVKFADKFSEAWQQAPEHSWQPQAATVAELGSLLAQQGIWSDIHNLEPLYVRRSYAEEKIVKA